jgi:hypothetical protein
LFDRWKCTLSLKLSARIEKDLLVSSQIDEIRDLRRLGDVKADDAEVIRHYDVF